MSTSLSMSTLPRLRFAIQLPQPCVVLIADAIHVVGPRLCVTGALPRARGEANRLDDAEPSARLPRQVIVASGADDAGNRRPILVRGIPQALHQVVVEVDLGATHDVRIYIAGVFLDKPIRKASGHRTHLGLVS